MPKPPPESTKTSPRQRLTRHAEQRWPALTAIGVRYTGSASTWSFAIYLASRDGYEDSVLPNGLPAGSPEDALDCARGLYLNDPTAWIQPSRSATTSSRQ